MSNEYLWDRSGEADEFALELERRLAPLDEAEALVDSLDLDSPSEHDAAEVIYLRPLEPPTREAGRARGWLWLAAAVALLAVGVGSLARASARQRGPGKVIEVAGSGEASGRIVIAASDPVALVALRPAHPALARCVAEFPPPAPVELSFELVHGEVRPSRASDDELSGCIRAAVEDLDPLDAVAFRFEIQ